MDQTNDHITQTKTQRVLQHSNVLSYTYYERMDLEETCLPAKYQRSSGHYIELSKLKRMVLLVK
jgi:hypothetical protein